MPNHFSTLGFRVRSEDDFVALAREAAETATPLECPGGCYLRWACGSGAELWLQVDRDGEFIGMNPHFEGESAVRVGLTGRITREVATALDRAFHGWADPAGDDPESGCYPFIFDAPDGRLHDGLGLPLTAQARIAAFAHEVSLFASPEAHAEGQEGEVKFASKSFIPSGLFGPPGDAALAVFTGHIVAAGDRRNGLTGELFGWALVETLGGVFDIVMDPELIAEPPRVGGVLSGSFWLSGRVLG